MYEAKYIFIDVDGKTLHIETRFKGAFDYSFNDIRCVLRKNIGSRLEFKDGKKIELNKANVLIETTKVAKKIRNIEKEDLPGVYFINKL